MLEEEKFVVRILHEGSNKGVMRVKESSKQEAQGEGDRGDVGAIIVMERKEVEEDKFVVRIVHEGSVQ